MRSAMSCMTELKFVSARKSKPPHYKRSVQTNIYTIDFSAVIHRRNLCCKVRLTEDPGSSSEAVAAGVMLMC